MIDLRNVNRQDGLVVFWLCSYTCVSYRHLAVVFGRIQLKKIVP